MLAEKETNEQKLRAVEEMFERFSESSKRLETKYVLLLKETEELREKLRAKDAEVKRAEKLALLGETAAALAHEVRNPLGAITLFLSMLRADVEDRPQALGLVDEIDKSVSSLNHVVSNMLHFAKTKDISKTPINLHSIVREVVQHFQRMMQGEGKITVVAEGSPFMLGEEHSLRQVFYNLLSNASIAVQYKGQIDIKLAERDGATVVVIHDNGSGIAPEVLDKIFDPFVSGRKEGTGLGLSIVRRILSQHGAQITARNNHGAEFEITFPRQ